ncbi:complex III assembly factor LYRM7-like [Ostrea edulis]|uniref:complex III assembly factor LYRM7-like n=1 Tax=Ostrea edulis TaxID=37623 RepID=UPI0024AEF336|nr:complex III assembly factor LYRM7-like [Ostrea edulis]
MTQVNRSQILSIFKKLHRVRQRAFKNDDFGLSVCRDRINDGFRKNINITDEAEVFKLYKTAEEVEMVMRTQLVQMEEVAGNTFRMNIREETHKRPNIPYDHEASISWKARKPRRSNDRKAPKES